MVFTVNAKVSYIHDEYVWSANVLSVDDRGLHTIRFDGCVVPDWAANGNPGPFNKSVLSGVQGFMLKVREVCADDDATSKAWAKKRDAWAGRLAAKIKKATMAGFKIGVRANFCMRLYPGSKDHFFHDEAISNINKETGFIHVGSGTVVFLEDELVADLQDTADITHVFVGRKVNFCHIDSGSDRSFDKTLTGTVSSVDATSGKCTVYVKTYNVGSYFNIHASLVY